MSGSGDGGDMTTVQNGVPTLVRTKPLDIFCRWDFFQPCLLWKNQESHNMILIQTLTKWTIITEHKEIIKAHMFRKCSYHLCGRITIYHLYHLWFAKTCQHLFRHWVWFTMWELIILDVHGVHGNAINLLVLNAAKCQNFLQPKGMSNLLFCLTSGLENIYLA